MTVILIALTNMNSWRLPPRPWLPPPILLLSPCPSPSRSPLSPPPPSPLPLTTQYNPLVPFMSLLSLDELLSGVRGRRFITPAGIVAALGLGPSGVAMVCRSGVGCGALPLFSSSMFFCMRRISISSKAFLETSVFNACSKRFFASVGYQASGQSSVGWIPFGQAPNVPNVLFAKIPSCRFCSSSSASRCSLSRCTAN